MAKKRKPRIQKFINYTKEAFFWPVHLVVLTAITALAALGVILVPELAGMIGAGGSEGLLVASVILMAGGLELSFLSGITQNPRFIRAINAKYQSDIDAFQKTKTMVDYYNDHGLGLLKGINVRLVLRIDSSNESRILGNTAQETQLQTTSHENDRSNQEAF